VEIKDLSSDKDNADDQRLRDDEEDESDIVEGKRLQDGGKRTWLFPTILQKLQGLCFIAQI